MERIASLSNAKVKLAASLHSRKHREAEGLFVAEGIRLVEMAAASGWGLRFAFCTPAAAAGERVKKIRVAAPARPQAQHAGPSPRWLRCGKRTVRSFLCSMECRIRGMPVP